MEECAWEDRHAFHPLPLQKNHLCECCAYVTIACDITKACTCWTDVSSSDHPVRTLKLLPTSTKVGKTAERSRGTTYSAQDYVLLTLGLCPPPSALVLMFHCQILQLCVNQIVFKLACYCLSHIIRKVFNIYYQVLAPIYLNISFYLFPSPRTSARVKEQLRIITISHRLELLAFKNLSLIYSTSLVSQV